MALVSKIESQIRSCHFGDGHGDMELSGSSRFTEAPSREHHGCPSVPRPVCARRTRAISAHLKIYELAAGQTGDLGPARAVTSYEKHTTISLSPWQSILTEEGVREWAEL